MDKKTFIGNVSSQLETYIDNFTIYGKNSQIRINPLTLTTELVTGTDFQSALADSEETVEVSAAAHGMENQDGADYQVSQNPDFIPVAKLIHQIDGKVQPNSIEIEKLAASYNL
ncbi:MAG: hypothetical protein NC097_06070 [Clostridium sp.]|nr:hypothetical protein [Prevotella sp.]MCM1429345.1 hypothetical protein [Clostridium sp.]MCM1475621.1 hypothetical protein [Muribaculaceae bacterium]